MNTMFEQMTMARAREMVAHSPLQRQMATAMFIKQTIQSAMQMDAIIDLEQKFGVPLTPEAVELVGRIEDDIRKCYRNLFGTELGG